MLYPPVTKKAMKLCFAAHKEQKDKSGLPYVFHPFHLAEQMTDEYTTCVALLHDIVEDTTITLSELAETFPAEVVDAVALLTHKDGVDYEEYISAIRKNPIAKTVKLAEIAHNTDLTRLTSPEDQLAAKKRWEEKYSKALQILK